MERLGDKMEWSDVGGWLQKNAGPSAALVGSLLVGNVPGAVAAGVALVSGATGHATPDEAMNAFQTNPDTVVKLRELANADAASIRDHIAKMTELDLADKQAEQHETQETIRNGDKQDDRVVRWTRPLQSWVSLMAAIFYCLNNPHPDLAILGMLLTLPFTYAGLRTVQHYNEMKANVAAALAK